MIYPDVIPNEELVVTNLAKDRIDHGNITSTVLCRLTVPRNLRGGLRITVSL